jgi:23S rRNA (adenine2503-C2)-methyltransferase
MPAPLLPILPAHGLPILDEAVAPPAPPAKALLGMTCNELCALMEQLGEPAYRGRQLAEALYRQRAERFEQISTLPVGLRQKLAAEGFVPGVPELAQTFYSVDGTERYLVKLADGETVEAVWMPNGDGAADETSDEDDQDDVISTGAPAGRGVEKPAVAFAGARSKRRISSTLCISSQVGCAVNCHFCFTAKLGIKRNLTAGEIVGQVLAILNRHTVLLNNQRNGEDPARINLVFMGQGEPFLNYDAFMAAFRLLLQEVGIPAPRMTVSTSGIVPAIERFAAEPDRPRLAVSLNAPNDELREQIMPINRKWNIAALLTAVGKIPFKPREFVMFEYVLLGRVNDRLEDANQVAALLRRSGLPAKVNLIAWNSGPGIAYNTPDNADVLAFQKHLVSAGIRTYIRRPRGLDIYAACGQLKRTVA